MLRLLPKRIAVAIPSGRSIDTNKLPFAVRMQKGLVTQAEEERRKGRYGYLSDLIPSFGGSDAPYFADMITEPIEKFDAAHFPDGREKNKAVTMW